MKHLSKRKIFAFQVKLNFPLFYFVFLIYRRILFCISRVKNTKVDTKRKGNFFKIISIASSTSLRPLKRNPKANISHFVKNCSVLIVTKVTPHGLRQRTCRMLWVFFKTGPTEYPEETIKKKNLNVIDDVFLHQEKLWQLLWMSINI